MVHVSVFVERKIVVRQAKSDRHGLDFLAFVDSGLDTFLSDSILALKRLNSLNRLSSTKVLLA